jgi:hypothetical protein
MKIKKNTTLSEQFQNPMEISQTEAKFIPLTHMYMTAHFHGLHDTVTSVKSGGVKLVGFMGPKYVSTDGENVHLHFNALGEKLGYLVTNGNKWYRYYLCLVSNVFWN